MANLELNEELKNKLRQSYTLSVVTKHLEPLDAKPPVDFPINLENFCKDMDGVIALIGKDTREVTKLLEECHHQLHYHSRYVQEHAYLNTLKCNIRTKLKELKVIK